MKRKSAISAIALLCLLLSGCTMPGSGASSAGAEQGAIPFAEGQSYAVAYLGYQEMDDLTEYAAQYLDTDELPVHYLSSGDYYLVIPRYADMTLQLYQSDAETMEPTLIYEEANAQPFVLQCNASDIFADAIIRLSREGETVEFSPFVSLKDGTLDIGASGLNLTKKQEGQS